MGACAATAAAALAALCTAPVSLPATAARAPCVDLSPLPLPLQLPLHQSSCWPCTAGSCSIRLIIIPTGTCTPPPCCLHTFPGAQSVPSNRAAEGRGCGTALVGRGREGHERGSSDSRDDEDEVQQETSACQATQCACTQALDCKHGGRAAATATHVHSGEYTHLSVERSAGRVVHEDGQHVTACSNKQGGEACCPLKPTLVNHAPKPRRPITAPAIGLKPP